MGTGRHISLSGWNFELCGSVLCCTKGDKPPVRLDVCSELFMLNAKRLLKLEKGAINALRNWLEQDTD